MQSRCSQLSTKTFKIGLTKDVLTTLSSTVWGLVFHAVAVHGSKVESYNKETGEFRTKDSIYKPEE